LELTLNYFKMKRIVYLTFYFKPDLSAGSFRNSSLAMELAAQAKSENAIIDIYSTMPNRYSTFKAEALKYEVFENIQIHRISLPPHKNGMSDQVVSFWKFYREVIKLNKGKRANLVFASSSRMFTAFLGYKIAQKSKALLYIDIRDIFVDTMNDVFKSKMLKTFVMPILKYIENKTFSYATHINLISGGFKGYFTKYQNTKLTYFSNGIDDLFLNKSNEKESSKINNDKKVIVYAGNIGEGQGLHRIIPLAAKKLDKDYKFLIIGDGGAKQLLKEELLKYNVTNVDLLNPIGREELQKVYNNADYLFLHLNDYLAFRKVLPSKIFELATFSKPILAGVSGYAAEFIKNEVSNSFVFEPCNSDSLVGYLENSKIDSNINRIEFINKFKRSRINFEMSESILSYL